MRGGRRPSPLIPIAIGVVSCLILLLTIGRLLSMSGGSCG